MGVGAIAAVAALFAIVLVSFHPSGPANPTATATASIPIATATAAAHADWTNVVATGEDVVFAPSDPTTGYTCELQYDPRTDLPVAVHIGVSRDAGKTWQTLPVSPGAGATCIMRISPTNAQDIALRTSPCMYICGSGNPLVIRYYVSTNGGASWAGLPLPAGASTNQQVDQYVWAGTTLFVSSVWTAQRPNNGHVLAASVDGGPLAWVDQNGLLADLPTGLPIGGLDEMIAGSDTTLFVNLTGPDCQNYTQCKWLWKTSDGGSTWTHIQSTYGADGVGIVSAGNGYVPLIGLRNISQGDPAPLLLSTNGGATWTALSALPANAHISQWLALRAPDGSIFMQFQTGPTDQTQTIYDLPAGASSWTPIVLVDNNKMTLAALSWDSSGHPTALWAADRGLGVWQYVL
jgi:hypothetical protein